MTLCDRNITKLDELPEKLRTPVFEKLFYKSEVEKLTKEKTMKSNLINWINIIVILKKIVKRLL